MWVKWRRGEIGDLTAVVESQRAAVVDGRREWERRRMRMARVYWEAETDRLRQRILMAEEDSRWEEELEKVRRKWEARERGWMDEEDARWEEWTAEQWKRWLDREADFLWGYREMGSWSEERWLAEEADWQRRLEARDEVEERRMVWRMAADVWAELKLRKEARTNPNSWRQGGGGGEEVVVDDEEEEGEEEEQEVDWVDEDEAEGRMPRQVEWLCMRDEDSRSMKVEMWSRVVVVDEEEEDGEEEEEGGKRRKRRRTKEEEEEGGSHYDSYFNR